MSTIEVTATWESERWKKLVNAHLANEPARIMLPDKRIRRVRVHKREYRTPDPMKWYFEVEVLE